MSLFGKIISSIAKEWNPQDCKDEKDFEENLTGFLVNREFVADKQYNLRGHRRIDIVVNDEVGIELKKDLNTSKESGLLGDIKRYSDSDLSAFIGVICRVEDENAWRGLKKNFNDGETENGKKIQLIRKDPSEGNTEIHPGKIQRGGGEKKAEDRRPGLGPGETERELWG